MSSGALFPSLVSGSRGSSSKYLVEFRAGKMTLKGNVVTPDKRKGTVYIQQSDDSLIHFCWKDRTSGNVDDVSNFKLITSVMIMSHFLLYVVEAKLVVIFRDSYMTPVIYPCCYQ